MDELELIMTAKMGGDMGQKALETLWKMHEGFMRSAHNFGPLGMRHDGAVRSKYAVNFNKFMFEIFETFRNAVRLFDPAAGASFRTFLRHKMKWDAMSYIRSAQKKVTLRNGEQVPVTSINYEDLMAAMERSKHNVKITDEENLASDLDRLNTDCDNNNANRNLDDDTAYDIIQQDALINDAVRDLPADKEDLVGSYTMGKHSPARDKIRLILSLFPVGSRKREMLVTYLKLAKHNGEDPTVREIGEAMGCTGANVSLQMSDIRKIVADNGITRLSAA